MLSKFEVCSETQVLIDYGCIEILMVLETVNMIQRHKLILRIRAA